MNKVIAQRAINYYGVKHQIIKTVEELTELSLALQHFLDGKATTGEVVTELADVSIMVSQMVEVLGEDRCNKERQVKEDRLIKRINKGGE